MLWQTYESASYVYFTDAPTKDPILLIFIFMCAAKEVLGTMMLNYFVNDSVKSSSSSDEEDIEFILFELACRPKSCIEPRLLDGRLLEQMKMDVNVGRHRRIAPTTLQYGTGQL